MSVTSDILTAWRNKWLATQELQDAFPGGLIAFRAKQGKEVETDAARATPYVIIKVVHRNTEGTHGSYRDIDNVNLTIYNTEDAVDNGDLISLIAYHFDWAKERPNKLSFSGINEYRFHTNTQRTEDEEDLGPERRQGIYTPLAQLTYKVITDTTRS